MGSLTASKRSEVSLRRRATEAPPPKEALP
jgi:hypothetical protein